MHASWENTTINVSKTAQLIPGYNLAVLDYGREYYGLNDTLAAHGQRKLEREAKRMSSEPAKATTNVVVYWDWRGSVCRCLWSLEGSRGMSCCEDLQSDESKIPLGDGRPGGRDAQWYRQNL